MKKSLFSSVFALAMLALLTGCGGGGGGGNNSGGGGTGTSPTAASLLNGQYSLSLIHILEFTLGLYGANRGNG